jgi:hypothetical protein
MSRERHAGFEQLPVWKAMNRRERRDRKERQGSVFFAISAFFVVNSLLRFVRG